MKFKKWIIVSLLLNVAFAAFAFRHYYLLSVQQRQAEQEPTWAEVYNIERSDVFNSLPIDTCDIVFVGNSLTEGFPFNEMLPGIKIKNRGIGANETIHLLHRLPNILSAHPKKLFIEIGINDLSEGITVDSAFGNYVRILQLTTQYKVPTYVQSLFPTARSHANLNSGVFSLNQKLRTYCSTHHIPYLNIYPNFSKNQQLDTSLTIDGIHLNGEGYKIWKTLLVPYL